MNGRIAEGSSLALFLLIAGAALEADQTNSVEGITIQHLEEKGDHVKSETLYQKLDSSTIGLGEFQNNYSSPEVWEKRWREYLLGTIGTGVALGDVDGDRFPDLFVVSKDEQSRLYRNAGGLKFVDISEVSGFTDSPVPASGCSFADVDNDGDLDLYVLYVGGANQLWINDGSGHFEEQSAKWGVDIANGCTMASFADFDRDGDLDFYLQNNLITKGENFEKLADQLFENRGDKFVEVTSDAGISGKGHGHAAIWWDYNDDQWPDIYVANDFEDLDRLYRNNGDGTFTDVISEVVPHAPYYSMGADFGDVNNDGQMDFWVADMAATSREHHLRTVGNHDHVYKLDARGKANQYLKNALLLKLDSNRFAETAFLSGLAATDWTWAARLVDMNNDGLLDAFATNGMLRSFHDGDIGTKQGAFASHDWMRIVFRNEAVMRERNLAFENKGDLTFEDRSADWGLDHFGISFGVAFGDLDGDGDLDFVTNDYLDGVSVHENADTENNRVTIRLAGQQSNAYGIGSQVSVESEGLLQVKELSLMRGYMSSDQPLLHFGLKNRNRIDRLEVVWTSGFRQSFTDLPVNRHYVISEPEVEPQGVKREEAETLFVPSSVSLPEVAVRSEFYHSDFGKQMLLPFPLSRRGGNTAMGDFNGDGALDLVLSGASGQETTLLLNSGGGQFQTSLSLDVEEDFGSEDMDLRLLDWEGDGDLDLLIASGGVELESGDAFLQDRLYRNEGDGTLLRDWEFELSMDSVVTSALSVGDYDGDGDMDIFQGGGSIPDRYPYTFPSRLWINEEEKLRPVALAWSDEGGAGAAVNATQWVDLDGDRDLDLIVASEWSPPIIHENDNGALSQSEWVEDLEALHGLWSSMAIEDLNGDGLLDIVLGNWGLNSEYRASTDGPMRLWYSGPNEVPTKLIESYVVDGKEWSREARWRMEKAFPRELRRIRSYEQFATMELSEMFPDLESQGFRFLEVNELRTGILWQKEAGRFTFQPLPSFAQAGRVEAILVEDVDADGRPDLILALDHPSPEPWSGRFEAGYLGLFLNEGEGRFETVLPHQSGLTIKGAPRDLAWGDLNTDGRPELVVQFSEGMPEVFSLSAESSE